MNEAVKEAVKAYECGDVPVGAVIVQNNKIIAAAHNRREAENDAAAHAEIRGQRKLAARRLRSVRYARALPDVLRSDPRSAYKTRIFWSVRQRIRLYGI